jgi:hypothetical protein
MHCLLAELMYRLFVLLVVCPCESTLVTRLLIDAHGAGVSIFDAKSAREANILSGKPSHRVRDAWNTRLSVLDHLDSAHVWHGYIVKSTVSASAPIVSIVVSPSMAASASIVSIVVFLSIASGTTAPTFTGT